MLTDTLLLFLIHD